MPKHIDGGHIDRKRIKPLQPVDPLPDPPDPPSNPIHLRLAKFTVAPLTVPLCGWGQFCNDANYDGCWIWIG